MTREGDDPDQLSSTVTNSSPPAAKIELFRSLFRGREDVYARRFESRKTGKSGYAPACANEWVRSICEKPRIKCVDCPNRRLLQVTDEVIGWHLSGRDGRGSEFVMGVYAMLQDEACFFLAVDFDGEKWQEDAGAFIRTCHRLDVPVALERSRSGNGGHIWFFFKDAVPATLARKLGSHILTETMEQRPDIGLDSYDRLFPNQDTLPKGGFGNLIALPLMNHEPDEEQRVSSLWACCFAVLFSSGSCWWHWPGLLTVSLTVGPSGPVTPWCTRTKNWRRGSESVYEEAEYVEIM